jgi:aspartate/methionine/tyrosine aminotransferase
VAPAPVIEACNAIQGHSTSNANAVAQRAALAALTGPQQCVEEMRQEYARRRDLIWDLLGRGPMRGAIPSGAFYLFLDVSEILDPERMRTSAQLAEALLAEARVTVFAGEGFDAPGFLRLSYAASTDALREGAARIGRFVDALARGEVGRAGR